MANDDDWKELNHATVEAQCGKMTIFLSLPKLFREIDSQPVIPFVVQILLISTKKIVKVNFHNFHTVSVEDAAVI